MSYTEIYGFDKTGKAYFAGKVDNAFRSAIMIWMLMEERYLPPYIPQGCIGNRTYTRCAAFFNEKAMQEVWDLVLDKNVPEKDRICMCTTFDNCLVKKEEIPDVVDAFRKFGGSTSLPEQAKILEKLYTDDNCIAVGWNQTSVNCDNWLNRGSAGNEYNCIIGEEHFWLFEELNKVGKT